MRQIFRSFELPRLGPGLLRLTLASVVFVYHVSSLAIGRSAVYIFFMLSGYWIAILWTSRFEGKPGGYTTYLISRFWRLLPMFVLASAFTWLLVYLKAMPSPTRDASAFEIIPNVVILGYNWLKFQPNGPAWSLDVEVQFYIFVPLLVIALRRSKAALVACVLISLASVFFRLTETLATYLTFFAIGSSTALYRWKPSKSLAYVALSVSIIVVVAILASPYRGIIIGGAQVGPLFRYNDPFEAALALAMAPWALFITQQPSNATDRALGDLSYIVYLIHWPINSALYLGVGGTAVRIFKIAVAGVLVYSSSWLIWRWIDRPIEALRTRWEKRALAASSNEVAPARRDAKAVKRT